MAVSNFVSQLPIVFQLQIHPLFSPLRDSDSDFATYSPKSIHPSQRQQEALERRMKGERRNCLLFIFPYFFFLILFSFQVSLAPKERVGFSLQLLSSVLLSVPPPFTAGTNGQEVSICSSEIWVPKLHTSPHIGILASAVTSSPISVFISYCLWLSSVFPVYSLTCPDPVKLVSSIKSPLYKIPSVISLLPNEPWLLQYLEV